eukprot:CAMPEP_0181139880 /NCGR_PEP_ID=MMETSP1071-20121207/35014_1 /TAXON_ID=35127 /ORGANISM="Thalassiosira sp., Strain NH16" /LENGTH=265 /DNA_ID=CAMNT_0023226809 /DNA_START=17 /DNA_END=814 /DNA_ORIENTATION=+
MPKLQAAVPAGAPPNALLRVRLPDGNEVNVRVPEGLKPGDEFIFEVSSIGEITGSSSSSGVGGGTANYSTKGGSGSSKKGEKSHKQSSKNPKKRRSHANDNASSSSGRGGGGGIGGGDHSSSSHQPNNHGGGVGGAPGFVTGFFNMYNQVYDILAQNNTTAQPKESFSRQSSNGGKGIGSTQKSNGNNVPSPIAHPSLRSSQQQSQLNARLALPTAPLGFLDRELANGKDFLTALAVGIFIGLSIVLGFLGGVLYVTPIAKGDRT